MSEPKSGGATALEVQPTEEPVPGGIDNAALSAPFPKAHAIYGLVLLILVSGFNYFDRALLGLMAPLIRRDILISDTTYGWISGFAFVLFYALLGIPIAALADRVSRRKVIAAGFTVWTIMTMLTGFVSSALQLAVTRFLVGAGEACASAPSNALINDMFRKETRGRALSIFFAVSSAISSIILVPIAGIVSAEYGWRAVFVVSGLAGLGLAALFFLTLKEPSRIPTASGQDGGIAGKKRAFFDFGFIRLPFILLVCSSALNGAHLNAAGAWSSIFLNRVHGLEVREIAVALGPFRGVLTAIGVLLSGYLVDRLRQVDERWSLWLPALACFLVTPSSFLFLLGEQRWVWMTGIGLDSLLLLMHVAPVYALAMDIAGPQRKALALSILMLSSSLIGSGIGPLAVGFMNDRIFGYLGPEAIRYSLLIVSFFPGLSAVMLVSSGHLLDRARRRSKAA